MRPRTGNLALTIFLVTAVFGCGSGWASAAACGAENPQAPVLQAAMGTAWGAEWRVELLEFGPCPLPAGDITFERTGRGPIWRGWVAVAGRRIPLWARARITRQQARIVAVERLAAGRPIADGQVRQETRTVFPEARVPAIERGEVVGRIPRTAIAAGAVVWPDALEPPRDVVPGGPVAVEVRQGRAVVVLEGRAQTGGRTGDWIVVRNPASGKIFRARITGPERAVTP
jgi:flagella basal body P-ring formation protein FlgA